MGRGGRRTTQTQVLCMPKSSGEWARFEAFLALASDEGQAARLAVEDDETYAFRPSVLVQQIFSLMRQSPTGTVRLAERLALLNGASNW